MCDVKFREVANQPVVFREVKKECPYKRENGVTYREVCR